MINSGAKSLITSFESETVIFNTSDNMTIAGRINYLSSNETTKPGIIFMHEMGAFVNNWYCSEVVL